MTVQPHSICTPGGCERPGCEGGQYCFDDHGLPLVGWSVIEFKGERHVMPRNECVQHRPNDCQCLPTQHPDDPNTIVHNAFDGREAFETDERRVS